MGRILAIDLGDVRIGFAVSDMLGIIANGIETYRRVEDKADIEYIANLVKRNEVSKIVLGLPINMDGTKGLRVEKTYAFAELIKAVIDLPIDYQDERMTTMTAERVLIEANVRREKRKTVIDKMAATIILQCYLDCHCARQL